MPGIVRTPPRIAPPGPTPGRRPRAGPPRLRRGTSLPEMMFGLTVAGLLLAGSYSSLIQGFRLAENARDKNRVAQILQNEVERMRTLTWPELRELPPRETYLPEARLQSPYRDRYQCERQLRERKPGQLELHLTVFWNDQRGGHHERRAVTFFTEGGLNESYVGLR